MSKGVSESEIKTEKFQNSVKTKTGKILQYFKDMYTYQGVFILTNRKQGGSSEEDATESDTSPSSKKSKFSASSSSEELMNENNGVDYSSEKHIIQLVGSNRVETSWKRIGIIKKYSKSMEDLLNEFGESQSIIDLDY